MLFAAKKQQRNVPKLWLTYAWLDNESEQVDYVSQEIRRHGISVHIDRTQLIAGQRLWPQLDKAISDPANSDAWAIYVTENSLRSEACLEELAYAIDRALRTRGTSFPLIGIFPTPIDRTLIPSAIATRLYVDLRDPDWASRVAAGVRQVEPSTSAKEIAPFHFQRLSDNAGPVYEVRPRAGRWYPFIALVKKEEFHLLRSIVHGPSGSLPFTSMISPFGPITADEGRYEGSGIHNVVDSLNSAFVCFTGPPSWLAFGQHGESLWTLGPENFKG